MRGCLELRGSGDKDLSRGDDTTDNYVNVTPLRSQYSVRSAACEAGYDIKPVTASVISTVHAVQVIFRAHCQGAAASGTQGGVTGNPLVLPGEGISRGGKTDRFRGFSTREALRWR